MSDARFPRRFAPLLVALLAVAVFQCRPHVAAPAPDVRASEIVLTQEEKEIFCKRGNLSKGRPMICIDNATLQPDPANAYIWDVEGSNGQPTTLPVKVNWFTRRSGNLQIEFAAGSNCVTNMQCNGRGHCVATVQPLQGDKERQCKYDVVLNGQRYDPLVTVNPCCT